MARRRRRHADLPFGPQGPTIPIVTSGRRGERFFEYVDRTSARESSIGASHGAIGTRSRQARGTCRASAGITIVDDAIAIVIQSVANFSGRRNRGHTRERSALTLERPRSTYAGLSRHTRAAAARIAFVDDAIAIVIDTVAKFSRWKLILIANDHPTGARFRTRATSTR